MPAETAPSSVPDIAVDTFVEEIKNREADKAQHIGDVSDGMRSEAQALLAQDTESQADGSAEEKQEIADTLTKQADQMDAALAGHEHIAVDQELTGTSTMGYAQVGGGTETVRLNADVVTRAATEGNPDDITDLVAHETAHATEQAPMEDIVLHGDTISAWQLHEAHSEFKGQEARGKSIHHHREGQPEDYAEAQKAGQDLVSVVSTGAFDEAMANGDSEGLQQKIWMAHLKDGSLSMEQLMQEGEETGRRDAALEALKQHLHLAA